MDQDDPTEVNVSFIQLNLLECESFIFLDFHSVHLLSFFTLEQHS